MRHLGIDFGERRIGLAISDAEGRIATPLRTLERRSDEQAVAAIRDLARSEGVEILVIGEPRRLDGTSGDALARVRSFAAKLSAATGLPCLGVEETLTSTEATARLREAGIDPRRRRAHLDAVAAQILLQDALDGRRSRP